MFFFFFSFQIRNNNKLVFTSMTYLVKSLERAYCATNKTDREKRLACAGRKLGTSLFSPKQRMK